MKTPCIGFAVLRKGTDLSGADLRSAHRQGGSPALLERAGKTFCQPAGAADVVLANLAGKEAGVFYQVGTCHALGKPAVLVAQSIDDLPFDLRSTPM